MIRMLFTLPQPKVTIVSLPDGMYDVTVLTNEEIQEMESYSGMESDSAEKVTITMYAYDGNQFRTVYQFTEDEILADLDKFLNYDTSDEPTLEQKQHDEELIDNYTLQLMDGGVL